MSDPVPVSAISTSGVATISAIGSTGAGAAKILSAAELRAAAEAYSTTQVDAALGGKADLVGGFVPTAQIPAIAITEYLGSVASQVAMLALVGDRGDWCLRSDLGTTWVLANDDSTLFASWVQLLYPTAPVTSVAGRTGAITLANTDISGLGTLSTQSGTFSGTSSGSNTGDQNLSTYVVGPATATDNAVARFDATTGKLIQNSSVTIGDTGASVFSALVATVVPVTVQGAALQTAPLSEWQDVAGTVFSFMSPTQFRGPNGSVVAGNGPGISFASYPNDGIASNGGNLVFWQAGVLSLVIPDSLKEFRVPSDYKYCFSSATNNNSASDTGFARNAAGVLEVNNGTAGTYRDIRLRRMIAHGSANNRAISNQILYGATTDAATAVELTTDGAAGSGATNRIAVPANTALSIVLNICVKQATSANAKQMLRQVVISNNAGVVAIQGTVVVLGTDSGSAGLTTVAVTITANDTDDCLKVEVTGVVTTNLRYSCYIVSCETLYA